MQTGATAANEGHSNWEDAETPEYGVITEEEETNTQNTSTC